MKTRITYDNESLNFVLEALGYSVSESGYIIKDSIKVLSISGEPVLKKDLLGFSKYGLITNWDSDIKYLKTLKND